MVMNWTVWVDGDVAFQTNDSVEAGNFAYWLTLTTIDTCVSLTCNYSV